MSEAVLSRFDLVFILLDKPDEQRDQMISDHVMAVRLFGAYDRPMEANLTQCHLCPAQLHSAQKKVHRKRKKGTITTLQCCFSLSLLVSCAPAQVVGA